jgi:hypothetical protein
VKARPHRLTSSERLTYAYALPAVAGESDN